MMRRKPADGFHGSASRVRTPLRRVRQIAAVMGLSLGALALGTRSAYAAVTIESFQAQSASTLAGAHADVTTSFAFATRVNPTTALPLPTGGKPSDIEVRLPAGLVGNLTAFPTCSREMIEGGVCPADTQVGTGTATINLDGLVQPVVTPVYNVTPGPGEAARLGIRVLNGNGSEALEPVPPYFIMPSTSATTGYAVTGSVSDISTQAAGLLAVNLTLWGIPNAHTRGSGLNNSVTPPATPFEWKAFMENPTDCSQAPLTALSVSTYEEPEVFTSALSTAALRSSCSTVPFAPSLSLTPDNAGAGAPAGLNVTLTTPQNEDANGQGTSDLRAVSVELPTGLAISPSAASDGLEGCTDSQFAAESDVLAQCPAASQIGTMEIITPLLRGALHGELYLGTPLSNDPTSGTMFRIFLQAHGFGQNIKLEGSVVADPQTGQLAATFSHLPELPFAEATMHFNGGANAVLVNPSTCGAHTTVAQLYPYSNPASPATPSSTFETSYDGNGAPCPSSLPFALSASVATGSPQAGALSPLTIVFARTDETQPLGQIDATLPKGLLGYVAKVQLCEAGAALAGTCGRESRIGTVSTTAGAGQDPLTVGGSVYLAHGSDGYPFMLSVVVPAVAGPYNLGNVVVPVWVQVNSNGSLTAISGPLPSILDGIPLDIRSVRMSIDRPGFAVNPTDCGPLSLSGTATSLSGAMAAMSAPFSVSGCGSLPFAPSFTVATQGSTSRSNGASLTVRVSQRSGEADIHSVHVQLPKSMPTRDSTLNNACTKQQFAANPAGCPPGSVVGTAVAYTPLLPVAVTGPAVLVSHAAAAFPDLDIILQGDGITIDLVGNTDIKSGVTSSTFASVPDVPISGFELNLPEGPDSILAAKASLCERALVMPTTITGQNGVSVTQRTPIAVTGCPKPKPAVAITKAKTKANGLTVTVKTTAPGTIKLSGAGLDTKTKKNVKAGTSQIELSLTKAGRAMRARHKQLKLRATLKSGQLVVAKTTRVRL